MAIIGPLLLLVLFGVIELGQIFFAYVRLQHAARSAARVAVTGQGESDGTRLSLIDTKARTIAAPLTTGGNSVMVRVNSRAGTGSWRAGDAGDPCDLVEVVVTYTYRPTIPLVSSLLPSAINLEGRSRKLNEPWVPCGP